MAIFFSVLCMLGQSMYALSAPCPMLHDHSDMSQNNIGQDVMAHDAMDHGNMNHSHMDHGTMMNIATTMDSSSEMDNCCGDDICPMNGCASAVLIQSDLFTSAIESDHLKFNAYGSHYLSVQANNLYRPPISL